MKRYILLIIALLQLVYGSKIFSHEREILRDFKISLLGVNKPDTALVVKTVSIKKKSVSQAMLFSFLLPGLGEKYVGMNRLSKYLIISEITLWSLYIYHSAYSGWVEDDYWLFAAEHAGVNTTGKDKKYFINIGNFSDIFGYNEKKRLDREEELVYNDVSGYYWRWDSDENRREFEDMRIKSDKFDNRLGYFITGVFLNHVISGINAAISAKKFNESIAVLSDWKLEYNFCLPENSGKMDMKLTLKFKF